MTKQENDDNRHRPNVPPLRFRGFTAPWQRKRIDQLYEEGTERGERGLLLSVSISSGVNVTDSFTKTRTVTDFSNYKVVHKGSIVYNTMRMWQGASGVSNYEGYVSPAYTVANPLESVSSTFFSYLLKNESLIHQFKINSQGLCSDTWTLKFPEFGRMEIGIPSLAEQEKIGTFFQALDELIAAREEELEKLRQMKAALLDAMFPNDASAERVTSATAHTLYDSLLDHTLQAWDIVPTEPSIPHTPRLRFRGFTDPWKRTRLGELADFNPLNMSLEEEFFYIDLESVEQGRLTELKRIDREFAPSRAQRTLKDNDILFQTVRPYLKNHYLFKSDKSGWQWVASTGYALLRPNVDPTYLYSIISSERINKEVMIRCSGTAYPAIRAEDLADIETDHATSLTEQKQIGAFFRSQDEGIATATEQIDKLKRIKQACLKQMFV